MNIIADILQDKVMEGWLIGKKRRSNHSNEVFATRKDRRIFDSQFLMPRDKKRLTKNARRAKSIKEA